MYFILDFIVVLNDMNVNHCRALVYVKDHYNIYFVTIYMSRPWGSRPKKRMERY